MADVLTNKCSFTLGAAITSSTQTSITRTSATDGLPGDSNGPASGTYVFVMTDGTNYELARVTGGQGTTTLTIARAVEAIGGTQTALSSVPNGTVCYAVETALLAANAVGAFNVRAYGATGNGTTDDTTAIQAAITAIGSGGGTLYFPPGTYIISSALTISGDNFLVLGAGNEYGPSIIKQTTANTTALNFTATSSSRLVTSLVRGLQIIGPGGTGSTSGAGIECACDVHLENVGVSGFYIGLYWQGSTYYSRAYGCLFTNCYYGVYESGTNNCTIDTCRITGAFSGYAAPIGPLNYGVYISCSSPLGLANRIINSSVEYFVMDGIYWDGGYACSLAGCYFETQQSSSGYAHVHLGPSNAVDSIAISDCYLQGDGTSGFNAISTNYASQVTIRGCYFGVNSAIGVTSTANSSDFLLDSNTFSPAATNTLPTSSYTLNPAAPPLSQGAPQVVNTVASSGTTQTIPDAATATMSQITLTANCALTLPSAQAGGVLWVRLTQDSTGSRTVTWPAGVNWPAAATPTLTTTAGAADLFRFDCINGSSWDGQTVGLDYVSTVSAFFGTPVVVPIASATSVAFAMSGVTSGQPILVFFDEISLGTYPTGISDTFSTPYTWTLVDEYQSDSSHAGALYIGTGGVGASGTVTATYASGSYPGGIAVPCLSASTASGLSAVDAHAYSDGASAAPASPSLTPTAGGEGAAYFVRAAGVTTASPGSPWSNTALEYSGSQYAGAALYASPPSGVALSASWTQSPSALWAVFAVIVKG